MKKHQPVKGVRVSSLHRGFLKRRKERTGIVFETDDIYALYERLPAEGVRFTLKPTEMPWGGIVADFLDPDGNELEVVQDPEHYKRKYHY